MRPHVEPVIARQRCAREFALDGNARLDSRLAARLDALDAANRPCLSAISLWEAATLASRGRLEVQPSFETWLTKAADARTVRILPITVEIAVELSRLPDTLHRDPVDRVIVATARVHQLPLLTADRAIVEAKLTRPFKP